MKFNAEKNVFVLNVKFNDLWDNSKGEALISDIMTVMGDALAIVRGLLMGVFL